VIGKEKKGSEINASAHPLPVLPSAMSTASVRRQSAYVDIRVSCSSKVKKLFVPLSFPKNKPGNPMPVQGGVCFPKHPVIFAA
jgi:hypothetical protein